MAARPKLMAIGDSMYHGVRSLTMSPGLADYSPPAQVARALNIPFSVPNPPRPILFDLEEELRNSSILDIAAHLISRAADNLEQWLAQRVWSPLSAFDNVSIGGATIKDLWTRTAGDASQKLPGLLTRMRQANGLGDLPVVAEAWAELATAYVLNPSNDRAYDGFTQVQHVLARNPEVLLINIGSNEGLFCIGFRGVLDEDAIKSVKRIPMSMQGLAEALKDLDPTTRVYANSLIRPRIIPNLAPRADNDLFSQPPGDYFPSYIAELGAGEAALTADDMRSIDGLIADVNAESKARMREILGDRFHWVDLYAASDRFDGKHWEDRKIQVQAGRDRTFFLRPTPLRVTPFVGGFQSGGLGSLDNMHLSAPGYALIADEVMQAMAAAADPIVNGATSLTIDKTQAFKQDTLLNNLPRDWAFVKLAFSIIRDAGLFRPQSKG